MVSAVVDSHSLWQSTVSWVTWRWRCSPLQAMKSALWKYLEISLSKGWRTRFPEQLNAQSQGQTVSALVLRLGKMQATNRFRASKCTLWKLRGSRQRVCMLAMSISTLVLVSAGSSVAMFARYLQVTMAVSVAISATVVFSSPEWTRP